MKWREIRHDVCYESRSGAILKVLGYKRNSLGRKRLFVENLRTGKKHLLRSAGELCCPSWEGNKEVILKKLSRMCSDLTRVLNKKTNKREKS